MINIDAKIKELKKLIRNNDYSDARILCERLVRDNQLHTELNFLLGLIYSKLNLKKRAQELLENTIYLDPNFYDALVELSLLYEKIGMHNKASNFRERAFRISHKITE
ncbi:MAG: hypothetical protein ABFS12_12015 [Bacteroidota bacterium]